MAFHVDLSSTATIVQIVGRYSATLDNDGAQRSRDIGARASDHGLQFKIYMRERSCQKDMVSILVGVVYSLDVDEIII